MTKNYIFVYVCSKSGRQTWKGAIFATHITPYCVYCHLLSWAIVLKVLKLNNIYLHIYFNDLHLYVVELI